MKTTTVIAIRIVLSILCLLLLSGCIRDRLAHDQRPISFEGSIEKSENSRPPIVTRASDTHAWGTRASETRASDTDWQADDRIGVYMVARGGTVSDNSLETNVMHRHAGGGGFVADVADGLYYPKAGRVDFVAYYPWRDAVDNHRLDLDVTDQSAPGEIDIMYSNNATSHASGDVPLLQFRHVLSKLVFNITDVTGDSTGGVHTLISGVRTRAVFDLSAGGLVPVPGSGSGSDSGVGSGAGIAPRIVPDGDDDPATVRLEAIVIPGAGLAPTVDFTFTDGARAQLLLDDESYLPGKIYIYNVTITASGRAMLTGGATIIDWDNGRAPENHQIPKTDPDSDDPGPGGGGSGSGPGGSGGSGGSKPAVEYFRETFGKADNSVKIDDYRGWDNAGDVEFSDRFDDAVVRSMGSLDAHIWFPPATMADLSITGLPTGYDDAVLTYDIAFDRYGDGGNGGGSGFGETGGGDGVAASAIRVYVGGKELTSQVTEPILSPNRYVRVSIRVPGGVQTSSLRFVSDDSVNIHGMRIDNVSLSGRR